MRELTSRAVVFLAIGVLPYAAAAAEPRVEVVVGAKAPRLERFAAEELAGQLKRLFDADVQIVDAASADAPHVILLGRPETNEAIRAQRDHWPKLSDQGHVLRSIPLDNRQSLLVGGGSPAATLWAAYELGQRFGIRYFLFGDLYPVTQPEFTLAGFDHVLEPTIAVRVCRAAGDSPLGPAMWGQEEHERVLKQMAKLKFNRIIVPREGWQPPAALRVDGDTAGRGAFRGAKLFHNPDFAGDQAEADRLAAGKRLIDGIVAAAQRLGMTTSSAAHGQSPGDVPRSVRVENETSVLPRADYMKLAHMPADVRGAALPYGQIGDLDLSAYYFSRAAFGDELTPEQACHDLVTPVCGEEVSTRVWKAFTMLQQATALIAKHDPQFGIPAPDMVLKHLHNEPPPAWWTEARDLYLSAMNEMYRANTRAREGGRSYTLYFARRCEFAFQYMNCLLAVRKAGIAKADQQAETRLAELETAVEAIYGALNALAAVARSSSDRGTIAVLNEYAYRPLKRELEGAEQPSR